jgi:hypothetical protein
MEIVQTMKRRRNVILKKRRDTFGMKIGRVLFHSITASRNFKKRRYMIINTVAFSFLTQQAFKMIAFSLKLMCTKNGSVIGTQL